VRPIDRSANHPRIGAARNCLPLTIWRARFFGIGRARRGSYRRRGSRHP
jgi:hypothetical protein